MLARIFRSGDCLNSVKSREEDDILKKYIKGSIESIYKRMYDIKKGHGVVNWLIDNIGFEAHLPGYQYCGPGTDVEYRVSQGQSGINQLDAACKEHDLAYLNNKDLETRHKADSVLIDKAWERFKSKDASVGEKAASWFVTTAMKAKKATGGGMKKGKGKTTKGKGLRVIPIPKTGGILEYLIPILTGLSSIGNIAGDASKLLKGKGLKLGPYKKGYGLYLRPYQETKN